MGTRLQERPLPPDDDEPPTRGPLVNWLRQRLFAWAETDDRVFKSQPMWRGGTRHVDTARIVRGRDE